MSGVERLSPVSNRTKIIIWAIVAVLVSVGLCWLSSPFEIGSYIGICGSVASVFGVWVAYFQIKSVKESTEATKTAIEAKISGLNNYLTLADMSRVLSLAKDAKTYVSASKLEIGSVRLSDLKLDLVLLRKNERLFDVSSVERLNNIIQDIGVDIVNIDSHLKKKDQLSIAVIVTHLEDALTLLADLEGKLKYQEL